MAVGKILAKVIKELIKKKGLSKGVEAARKMKFPEKHVKKALVSHFDDVLRREPGKGYPGIKKIVKDMKNWSPKGSKKLSSKRSQAINYKGGERRSRVADRQWEDLVEDFYTGESGGIRNADLRKAFKRDASIGRVPARAMKLSPRAMRQLEKMQLDPRRLPVQPRRASMFDDSVVVHGRRRPDHPTIPSPLTTFKGPKY